MKNKRKLALILVPLLLIAIILPIATKVSALTSTQGKLIVNFIDVLNGDCTLIQFPNGKTMLIDCGDENLEVNENTAMYIKKQGVKKLDYLILSNTREEHIAGALNLLNLIKVEVALLPKVLKPEKFFVYSKVLALIESKNIQTQFIDCSLSLSVGCEFQVLSPFPSSVKDSSLNNFNATVEPTEQQIKDISPIIYLGYKDTSFVLSSDAGESEELKVLSAYRIGSYKNANLNSIALLKVGDHGHKTASSSEFINFLNPEYAVISTTSNSGPNSQVLESLQNVKSNVLRTDVVGNVMATINKFGHLTVKYQY